MPARARILFVILSLFTCFVATQLNANPRVADVVLNDEIVPLGMLEPALKAQGYEINIISARNINVADLLARDADLLIILGGRQSVTDMQANPYFYDELALIRSRESRGRATLGLCLGAQLMALAFGGKVERGPVVEQGWTQLHATTFTEVNSPIRELITSQTQVYSSHEDAIVAIPQNALLLAQSDLYNQVFLIGKNTMAIQFHPEATPEITSNWLTLFGSSPETVARKKRENEKRFAENQEGLAQFWVNWLTWVATTARNRSVE